MKLVLRLKLLNFFLSSLYCTVYSYTNIPTKNCTGTDFFYTVNYSVCKPPPALYISYPKMDTLTCFAPPPTPDYLFWQSGAISVGCVDRDLYCSGLAPRMASRVTCCIVLLRLTGNLSFFSLSCVADPDPKSKILLDFCSFFKETDGIWEFFYLEFSIFFVVV